MFAISVGFVLNVAMLSAGADSYDQAYHDTASSGRPLLVLVGADWCPGCRTMKQSVLPQMASRGRLNSVNYTIINTDVESALASRLMRGNMIPQLIVFSKKPDGRWHREQITGAVGDSQVQAMIDRALRAQAPPSVAQAGDQVANGNGK
jgi:thioredoxin-like negative regulator of GroEL